MLRVDCCQCGLQALRLGPHLGLEGETDVVTDGIASSHACSQNTRAVKRRSRRVSSSGGRPSHHAAGGRCDDAAGSGRGRTRSGSDGLCIVGGVRSGFLQLLQLGDLQ